MDQKLDGLIIKRKRSEEFNSEDITAKLNGNLIFAATRYNSESYSSTFWPVDSSMTKEDHLKELVKFYEAINQSKFKERGTRGFPLGILLDEFRENPFPLEYLNKNQSELLNNEKWKDFFLFRVDTLYAAFTMEDFSGEGWKPETGMITVISHNDLSVRVAELIAETSKYYVPAGKLQPVLAQNVYNFR